MVQDTSDSPISPDTATPPPGGKPRKRRHLLTKVLLALILAAVLGLVLGVPLLLSSGWTRGQVESAASQALNTEVKLGALDFGWLSGVKVEGLRIANPAGFPTDHDAVAMQEASFGLSGLMGAIGLGSGGINLTGVVKDLKVVVDEDGNGRTNLDAMLGRGTSDGTVTIEERTGDADPAPAPPADREIGDELLAATFDFRLTNGEVEIRREGRLVEAMRGMECRLEKAAGTATMTAHFETALEHGAEAAAGVVVTDKTPRVPGRVQMDAAFDAQTDKVQALVEIRDLDLGNYAPLLRAAMRPGQVDALAGVVDGTVKADGKASGPITATTDLRIREPRVRGGIVQWMNVSAPEWRIESTVAVEQAAGKPKLVQSLAKIALGFATIEVLPEAERAQRFGDDQGLAVGFTADIGKVLAMGGPIPDYLQGSKGKVSGGILVPVDELGMPNPENLVGQLLAAVDIGLQEISASGFTISGLNLDVGLKGGKLVVSTPAMGSGPVGSLNGGPLELGLNADLLDMLGTPAELSLNWQGGRLTGPTGQVLRYGVPLLAGLGESAELVGLASIQGSLRFPLQPAEGEDLLAWLDRFTGQGDLGLKELAFQPAGSLAPLAEQLGDNGRLRIRDLSTSYSIRAGSIQHKMMKLNAKGTELGLTGETKLAGGMDYMVDLKPLLAAHKDGAKVLQYLGDNNIEAGLTGTVDAPKLAMPDLDKVLTDALKGQVQNAIQGGIQKGLGEIFGGKKKDDDGQDTADGSPKEGSAKEGAAEQSAAEDPEAKAKQAVRNLLRRVGGGG